MLVNIANAQAKLGADVYLMIINDEYETTLLNALSTDVKICYLHRKKFSKNLNFILKFNYTLKQINPNVIHLHDPHLFGIIFNQALRRKTCATLHDMPDGQPSGTTLFHRIFPILNFRLPGNVAFLNKIPYVFSISKSVGDSLLKKTGVKSIIVNNGILTSKFKIRNTTERSKQFNIVQVSRLDHIKKGQDLILEAISRLGYDVKIDFIGEGDSLDYLKDLSKQLDIENRVRFLGKKTQAYLYENLCKYDLFVQPSRYEGFGLTVAEAVAANVPVLVSEGDGPAEITCGNKYGWTFENSNVNDLTNKLIYIYNHYTEAIKKTLFARNYIVKNYDVSATASRYLKEYKNILDNACQI